MLIDKEEEKKKRRQEVNRNSGQRQIIHICVDIAPKSTSESRVH